MTREDAVGRYVELCATLCKAPEDYTPANVKRHNRAVKECIKLEEELGRDAALERDVYLALIENEDDYVRQSAAARCLELGIETKKAVKIIKSFRKSQNPMSASWAERTLKLWRGKIGPNDPF